MTSTFPALARMLAHGSWAQNRTRLALTIIAIALGVALGTTVHLVNHSAVAEFESAVRALSGDADVQVSGPRSGFDEALYPQLAERKEVSVASPVLEIEAKLAQSDGSLKVVGLDPFRALSLQPALLGEAGAQLLELLRPNTVMLSHAAAQKLALAAGDTLHVQVGLQVRPLEVIAILPASETLRQPLALMDIASAQWTFDQLGRLSRIDLRLRPEASVAATIERINQALPVGLSAIEAEQASEQGLAMSRAYRVNLNMLALVSLFTGAVLVFSTQTLSALRRRTHFALLRALGVSSRMLVALLTAEGILLGIIGTSLGLLLGILGAHLAVSYAGSDLGAGFFAGVVARSSIDPLGLAIIACCGLAASALGGFVPALEAGRAAPAAGLRAGDEQRALDRVPSLRPGLVLLSLGGGFTLLPAVDGLPMFGYAAVAAILLGALFLMPAYVRAALAWLPRFQFVSAWLGLQQLRGSPGYAGISLAAILASFSLVVSMLIMIQSFRLSLDDWLAQVLPADLYARAGSSTSVWIDREAQTALASASSVARVGFSRFDKIQIDPGRPAVTLIARDLRPEQPDALPLIAPQRLPVDGTTPAWISEAMHDLYRLGVGDHLVLPVGGARIEVRVAGIWRDYVRQGGTVLIPRDVYIRTTGDTRANEAWIWLHPGTDPDAASDELRTALRVGAELEIRQPGTLRELSLQAFDRTFAVTYALQVAALVIGLFGISVGTSAQALARRREFGVLHHLGMSMRELRNTVALEGGVVGALGAFAGLVVGSIMSLVLIHVINRQSFHWSMELHVPWLPLTTLSLLLVSCAALTAALSIRRALGADIIRAVKEDW